MPASDPGLPVWQPGVWASTVWETGVWASSGSPAISTKERKDTKIQDERYRRIYSEKYRRILDQG